MARFGAGAAALLPVLVATTSQAEVSMIDGCDIEVTVRRGEIMQVPPDAAEPGMVRYPSHHRLPTIVGQIVVRAA